MGWIVLGQKYLILIGLLLQSEGIDELVILLKILIIPEEEDDLIDMILGCDGRT